jgi:hypothetical protein
MGRRQSLEGTLIMLAPSLARIASPCLLAVAVLSATCSPASSSSRSVVPLEERLALLEAAYPEAVKERTATKLVMANGASLTIDDGREKSHAEKLADADIEDMLSQIYPLGKCVTGVPARNADPGRIRNEAFFRAVYGETEPNAASGLTTINWFGTKIRFTRIGRAHRALEAVERDLAELPMRFRRYLVPSAGTFNWRPIAGTRRLSVHSFGAAIDINTKYADYWRWSGGKPGDVPAYRNRIPAEIVEIFERHGFIWGGRWYHYDTMHFEYRPAIIAIARRNLERGCGA